MDDSSPPAGSALDAPLCFAPVYKQALWGGSRIASRYGRPDAPGLCAESWELSAHPDGAGPVLEGPLAGRTLTELSLAYGRELLGTAAPDAVRFPLLFKLIDARERLSIQVHPNHAHAARTGGEPKTEMWYLLDAGADAALYAGLVPGTTPQALRAASVAGRGGACLVRLHAAPGRALFIPGGLVHAIGAGCLIYEVQQSSNTTYRLDDWGRVGPDGKPRPVHVDAAMQAIDWTLPPPDLVTPVARAATGSSAWAEVIACPFFRMRLLEAAAPETLRPDGSSFHAFFLERGEAELATSSATVTLKAGSSCLLPAAARRCTVTPGARGARMLVTTLA